MFGETELRLTDKSSGNDDDDVDSAFTFSLGASGGARLLFSPLDFSVKSSGLASFAAAAASSSSSMHSDLRAVAEGLRRGSGSAGSAGSFLTVRRG